MHAYHELVTCFLSKSPDPLCKGEQFDNDNEKLEATKNFLFSGQTQSSLTQDMNEWTFPCSRRISCHEWNVQPDRTTKLPTVHHTFLNGKVQLLVLEVVVTEGPLQISKS
jgi:hypothetical protein